MSTGSTQPFNPASNVQIAATTSSQSAPSGAPGPDTVLVYNSAASIAFVSFSVGAGSASLVGFPVPPGASRLIWVGPYVTAANAVLASGTGAVYFSFGTGTVY